MGDYKNGMRPIKISFSSPEERNNVMREFKYSQMNSNHTSNIRKLILMDDLTPKQRNSMRELVKEKTKRRTTRKKMDYKKLEDYSQELIN